MGLLDRINTLIKANVNDLVQRSDEPERALDSSIGEMEASTREARSQMRQVERQEGDIIRRYERGREEAGEWEDRAMTALREGDETLARECLEMKRRAEAKNERLREELDQQRGFIGSLSRSLDALEGKISAFRSRRNSISSEVRAERPKEAGGGFTLPGLGGGEPVPDGGRAEKAPEAAGQSPAEEKYGEGKRAFLFDKELRREHPEDVFDVSKPFEAFSDMADRLSDFQSQTSAESGLDFEDPLRDDLADRFERLESRRDVQKLKERAGEAPADDASGSSGGAEMSDLKRRLMEELEG